MGRPDPGHLGGLDNYRALLDDPTLRAPFGHALVLVVFFSVLPVVLGLALAGAACRGPGCVGSASSAPWCSCRRWWPWSSSASPGRRSTRRTGPLNDTLSRWVWTRLTTGWLGDPTLALPAVGLVGTWVGTGLCVVLFLAGLSQVPREQYEAARLDGAGPVREFLAVGLPALRGEIAVAVTLTVIAALRTFDLVYVMTSGGPGGRTRVPAYEVYDRAFVKGEVGLGRGRGGRADAG